MFIFFFLFSLITARCLAMSEIESFLQQPDPSDHAMLLCAVRDNDIAFVRDMPFDDFGYGLHAAAAYERNKCLKILLNRGANPNGAMQCGYAPLHFVRSAKSALLLLNAGAKVDIKSKAGITPLYTALRDTETASYPQKDTKKHEIASLLLARGANVNYAQYTEIDGRSLLHQLQQPILIDLLLSHPGTDAHIRDYRGLTAFESIIRDYMSSGRHKSKGMINQRSLEGPLFTIFEKYGMVFFPDIKPIELLHIPQEFNLSDINYVYAKSALFNNWVRLLACVQRNKKHSRSYNSGVLSNHYGCMIHTISSEDVVHYFGKHNIKNISNAIKEFYQYMISVIRSSNSSQLDGLIDELPWIMTYDHDKTYEMMVEAIKLQKTDCLNVLLEKKIDPHQVTRYKNRDDCDGGGNFLHMAVFCDNPDAVKLLARYDVDLLQENGNGKTPLEYAIQLDRQECKKLLNSILCDRCARAFHAKDYSRAKSILDHIVDCSGIIADKHFPLLHDIITRKNEYLAKLIPLLLAKGADINACDKAGDTALWRLIGSYGERYLVNFELLLKNGAYVNKGKNMLGWSLLRLALFRKEYILAKLFLEHGAVVTKKMRDQKYKKIPQKLHDLLQKKYKEQRCCICLERPDDLSDIPCKNRCKGFLCGDCYGDLHQSRCPLCRGELGKF